MTRSSYQVGDKVWVQEGSRSIAGVVLGVLPDPRGLGRDMVKVRLDSDERQVISLTVPASEVRPARGE